MPDSPIALRQSLLRAASAQPWVMERAAMDMLLAQLAAGQLLTPEAHVAAQEQHARLTPAQERAAARKAGAVAVINVQGVIANRQTFMDWLLGMNVVPPAAIANAAQQAIGDPDVKALVITYDTPGGVSGGVVEAFDRINALRGSKPIVSQVIGNCSSAGYWLASAADEICITPSGMAGSIGVYMTHEDISGMLAQEGVVRRYIDAPQGGYKVEGNEAEPLGEAAEAHIREMVNDTYGQFVRSVATGRGVAESVVRSEQFGLGRTYSAARCVQRGMADKVRGLAETIAALGGAEPVNPSTSNSRARSLAQAAREGRLRGVSV
jgi:signal peptide peptidase SppA